MKLKTLIFLWCICGFACKAKDSTEDNLKNAMQTYLYNDINKDSSDVKYRIQDVTYYMDKLKGEYICVFKVNLHVISKSLDTTGIMKAYISKDFKTVKHYY